MPPPLLPSTQYKHWHFQTNIPQNAFSQPDLITSLAM